MVISNKEVPTLESVIMSGLRETLKNTHTNLLAIVTKVGVKTISCKPVMSRQVGTEKIDLPEFVEVPIINLLGGSSSIQLPIAIGDYCILFVSEVCIDGWYAGKDFDTPTEPRLHDYSDSIALVGIKNKAGELDIPTVITILGDTYQEGNYEHLGDRLMTGDFTQTGNLDLTGDYTQLGSLTVTGDVTITGEVKVTGNITCSGVVMGASLVAGGSARSSGGIKATGDITTQAGVIASGDVVGGGISLTGHKHSYTWTEPAGSGNTGTPS